MALTETNYTNSSVTCVTNSHDSQRDRRAETGDRLEVITTKIEKRIHRGQRLARQRDLDDWVDRRNRDQVRGMWEQEAERRIVQSRIRREVEKAEAVIEEDLERRRNRLSELLRTEEEDYLRESVVHQQEDPASKSARMFTRYVELRTQKEEERRKLAEEKREQQFKRNCDELRTSLSHRLHHDTAEEGRKILAERRRNASKDEDSMYSEMWMQDEEKKRRREDEEEKTRRRKGTEWGAELEEQMRDTRERRRREVIEKEEEREIRAEQIRLLQLEEESTVEARRRKQEAMRRDLDECLRTKLKTKEVQDDLLEDIFFLTHLMGEEEDRAKKIEKKKSLMHEQQEFLQYLRDQAKKESDYEKELQKMCSEELERAWSKRRQEEEGNSKRKGTEEVQRQITDNLEKWRNAQSVSREYAEKVMLKDQEDRRREDERSRLTKERNLQHQRELEDQIRQRHEKQDQERHLLEREQEAIRRVREMEDAKIRHLVAEMEIECLHPYRVVRKEAFDDCRDNSNSCFKRRQSREH